MTRLYAYGDAAILTDGGQIVRSVRAECGLTACPSAAASAPHELSKCLRSRARSGRLHGRVRRSGRHRAGCQPHAPTTSAPYHAGITNLHLNHTPYTITLPRTSAPHNGPAYHALHHELPAQRAFVPRRHNGLVHDGAGTTGARGARLTAPARKREANHVPRTPNGLAFSCRERAA